MIGNFFGAGGSQDLDKSSVKKIINPGEFIFNNALVIVLIISIAVKLYMAYYNKKYGKKIDRRLFFDFRLYLRRYHSRRKRCVCVDLL